MNDVQAMFLFTFHILMENEMLTYFKVIIFQHFNYMLNIRIKCILIKMLVFH